MEQKRLYVQKRYIHISTVPTSLEEGQQIQIETRFHRIRRQVNSLHFKAPQNADRGSTTYKMLTTYVLIKTTEFCIQYDSNKVGIGVILVDKTVSEKSVLYSGVRSF